MKKKEMKRKTDGETYVLNWSWLLSKVQIFETYFDCHLVSGISSRSLTLLLIFLQISFREDDHKWNMSRCNFKWVATVTQSSFP